MIQDLISNIIQNSVDTSPEGAQNLLANDQLKTEFSALLHSLKKENVSDKLPENKHVLHSNKQSEAESIKQDAPLNSEEFNITKQEKREEEYTNSLLDDAESTELQIKSKSEKSGQTNEGIISEGGSATYNDQEIKTGRIGLADISELTNAATQKVGEETLLESPKNFSSTAHVDLVNRDIFRQEVIQDVSGPINSLVPELKISELNTISQELSENVLGASEKQTFETKLSDHGFKAETTKTEGDLSHQSQNEQPNAKESNQPISEKNRVLISDSLANDNSRNTEPNAREVVKIFDIVESDTIPGKSTNSQNSQAHLDVHSQPNQPTVEKRTSSELTEIINNDSTGSSAQITASDQHKQQIFANEYVAQKSFNQLRNEAFTEPIIRQQANELNQIEQVERTQHGTIPSGFSEGKNPELIQFIQSNKSEVIKPKEAKDQRFALSMTEQAETRLRLLVDSVRPEILSSREAPVGFITTHSLEEKIQFFNPTLTLSTDQEAFLKEFMMETTIGKDQKATEQNLLGYLRLGELPLANAQARLSLVSSFAKAMQQEIASPSTRQNEGWQKHSFKLDDGNNIDMTTKNVDGILHIKLAASNPELNRLLMHMEQEIKDHLKEELNLELELQFANEDEQSFSDALSDNSGERRNSLNQLKSDLIDDENSKEAVKSLQPSIRDFGYNQMEWTA